MKKFKKCSCLILCLFALCCGILLTACKKDKIDTAFKIDYEVNADGSCTITKVNNCTEQAYEIPSELDGHSVTAIGDYAFQYCSTLTEVTVPNGVTSIGSHAFDGCFNMTKIDLPDSVTSLGTYAFGNCISLADVEIPAGVTKLDFVFFNCSALTEIAIPDGLTSIDNSAFYGCSSLATVTMPKSVTNIGTGAFYGCSSLKDFTIPNTITNIGSYAFKNCSSLDELVIPESVKTVGDYAFEFCSGLTTVSVPTATTLGMAPFAGCSKVREATIPATVVSSMPLDSLQKIIISGGTTIGSNAFSDCGEKLTSVTIPTSITSIANDAFEGCTKIREITVPTVAIAPILKYSADSVQTVVINSGTELTDSMFKNCKSLKSITIPKSITSIGETVFVGCPALTTIEVESGNSVYHSDNNCLIETASKLLLAGCQKSVIPNDGSVTVINAYAFADCTNLPKDFKIPEAITEIGAYAFTNCTKFATLALSKNVTKIGEFAFLGCSALATITVDPENTAYSNGKKNCLIDIEAQTLILGCKASELHKDENILVIGESAFLNCVGLKSIVIPTSVTTIESAFMGCTDLKKIHYGGTPETWETVSIDLEKNDSITYEEVYYYSEDKPTDTTHTYWYYNAQGFVREY